MEQSAWPRFLGEEMEGKTVGLLGFGAIAFIVNVHADNRRVYVGKNLL